MLVGEPALEAFGLDHGCESLIEVAVPRRIDLLVRKLVEDESREVRVPVAEHRVQHRVAQVPERRVGNGRADENVKALVPQLARLARRARLVEVAAVAHAARDRKAPVLRLDRKLGRREKIPGDVAPAEVGVSAVTAVVRKTEIAHSEIARPRDELEPAAQRRIRARACDHLLDRLALSIHLHLPLARCR
jgi:hypothetical protein